MSKYAKIEGSAPDSDGDEYSRTDVAHFDALTHSFPIAVGSIHAGDVELAASALRYTESDTREFRKLANFGTEHKGGCADSVGYTDSDDRLFKALNQFGANKVDAAIGSSEPGQGSNPDAVVYTPQDLQTFHAMMPDSPGSQEQHVAPPDGPGTNAGRDVGPIRIVDFDKQHSRAKENRRRGPTGMKIRFFD